MTDWRGTVGFTYGSVTLMDAGEGGEVALGDSDVVAMAQALEDRCAALETGFRIFLLDGAGEIPVTIRVLEAPSDDEPDWDHVVELSASFPSGRALVFSWMPESDLAGEVEVPIVPLRARVHWGGLEAALQAPVLPEVDVPSPCHVRVDLFPGPSAPVRTIRTWPTWEPPEHESIGQDGLRRYRGVRAVAARQALEWVPRMFWSPYPETPDGTVTGVWRDPSDGTRWADGTGPHGHAILRELTDAEADALEATGYPSVRTYAIDADGRAWTSDLMPLERVPCISLVPPWQFELVRSMPGGLVGVQVIDLPDGWSRMTLRPPGGGSPLLVEEIHGDGTGTMYQRWRDDVEIPA